MMVSIRTNNYVIGIIGISVRKNIKKFLVGRQHNRPTTPSLWIFFWFYESPEQVFNGIMEIHTFIYTQTRTLSSKQTRGVDPMLV